MERSKVFVVLSPSDNSCEHVDGLNVGPRLVVVVRQVLVVGDHFVGVGVLQNQVFHK